MSRQKIIDAIKAEEERIAIEAEIVRRKTGTKLLDFGEEVYPQVEAGKYLRSWFHEIIADELEEWDTNPDSPFLLIMVPPRHGKSQIVSRFLPPYLFGKNPDKRIIATSYGQELADDMSRDCQAIMLTDAYKRLYPNTRLSSPGTRTETDKRTISHFTIIGGAGYYIGKGVGGGITGRGADRIIIDDPVKNRKDAESETYRESVWKWYTSTLRTRLQKGGKIVLLLTRWHEDDLAGRILDQMKNEPESDRWRVISFPALFEKTEFTHPLDKRKKGEPLWPEMYDEKYLKRTRATQGTYDWSALYQQRPAPSGGAVIKRDWLKVIPRAPAGLNWVRFWDLAVSKKTSANHSASSQIAFDEVGNCFKRRIIRLKEEWPTVRKEIISTARIEQCPVGVEEAGQQKGFIDDLIAEPLLRQIPIQGYTVEKDKLTRALPWIARAEQGKFFIVDGHNVDKFINEAVHFTGHDDKEDDMIDETSGGYRMLALFEEAFIVNVGQYEH